MAGILGYKSSLKKVVSTRGYVVSFFSYNDCMPVKFKCTPNELRNIVEYEIKSIDETYFVIIQIDQLYNRKN